MAAASAARLRRSRQSRNRAVRLERYYHRGIQRVKGDWPRNGTDGGEFSEDGHPYAKDLNVFGEGSLFELLCTVRTANGQRGLAQYLLTTPALEETLLRQDAIRELRERSGLHEEIALLGDFEFCESRWETFAEWLHAPRFPFSTLLRIVTCLTSTLVAVMVLLGFATTLVPWVTLAYWITPILVFHAAVGLLCRRRVKRMLDFLHPISVETQVLRQGLQLLERQQFHSVKLCDLAKRVRDGSKAVRKLERLLNAVSEREKPWFYPPSLTLALATQLCMAIEAWRSKHGDELRIWLDAWAEFEALNALATYAYEHPENTFPEFSTDEVKFEAKELGHPLLPRYSCVRNDIRLDSESRFYVLSGSNMSGKSTLLRAIGLNAVLAFAGAPVRARSLRLTRLSIWASLSVVDSLLNGKSKFLTEVERLRETLGAAQNGDSVLFLVDEIFSGTNSRDRRVAAEAVVRALLSQNAIGVLSMHDVALCEIATPELRGVNLHMSSRGGDNPMDFDYRLKQGVTTESKALAIARMAGVPV